MTGLSTGTDAYYRINGVSGTNIISVKKTASDVILTGQQVIDLGPWVSISSASHSGGVTTFDTTAAHG